MLLSWVTHSDLQYDVSRETESSPSCKDTSISLVALPCPSLSICPTPNP